MSYKRSDLLAKPSKVVLCGEPSTAGNDFYDIGGPVEVRELMHDLRRLLAKMDPPSQDGIWKEVANDATVDMLERDLCQCVTCIDKAWLINRIRADALLFSAVRGEAVRAIEDGIADGASQWSGGLHRIIGMVNGAPG